jgi:thiamine biosynthesis protein ThiS
MLASPAVSTPSTSGVDQAKSNKGGNVTINVNGEPVAVPEETTVSALLDLLNVEPAQIAVELDGSVVHREAWSEVPISSGATLEIVRFVGGG